MATTLHQKVIWGQQAINALNKFSDKLREKAREYKCFCSTIIAEDLESIAKDMKDTANLYQEQYD